MVQEFDPLGVAARNLRECMLIQLRTLDPQNSLAQQIVSECMPKRPLAPTAEEQECPETPLAKMLQGNQLKEVARALNRPVELVKRAMDMIRGLDPRPGACATTRRRRAWSSPTSISARWTTAGKYS